MGPSRSHLKTPVTLFWLKLDFVCVCGEGRGEEGKFFDTFLKSPCSSLSNPENLVLLKINSIWNFVSGKNFEPCKYIKSGVKKIFQVKKIICLNLSSWKSNIKKSGIEENFPWWKNSIKNVVQEKLFRVGKIELEIWYRENFSSPKSS